MRYLVYTNYAGKQRVHQKFLYTWEGEVQCLVVYSSFYILYSE